MWGHQEGRVHVAILISPYMRTLRRYRSCSQMHFLPLRRHGSFSIPSLGERMFTHIAPPLFATPWRLLEGKGYVVILITPHHGDPEEAGLCTHIHLSPSVDP